MTEQEAILKVNVPNTKDSLVSDLRKIGVCEGDLIIAHASLSQLGWVVGREVAVINALLEAIGPCGTLIMPSQSGDNTPPEYWQNPPVPKTWIEIIKANMPAYDCQRTPTRAMGKVVDALLKYPGVIRSNHPQVSFCGFGPLANEILSDHALTPGLGDGSPLKKLYDHHSKILLLGVGYGNCTSLHLSESHLPNLKWQKSGAKMSVNGQPEWVAFDEIIYNDEDFDDLGKAFEENHSVSIGTVGAATCRLIEMRELCDFGEVWLRENRQ